MKNILILEDDLNQAVTLQKIIVKNFSNLSVTICLTEQEAREKANSIDFHIMFIDIILEYGSGLEFARWVRTLPNYQFIWIIMVTGHDIYSMDAIRQIHCFDYIIKPYQEHDMLAILEKVMNRKVINDSSTNYLAISSKGMCFKIKLKEIIYIEINNKNMDIQTTTKLYSVKRYPLSKIKDQLPKAEFMQCHRSYIINIKKISAVESKSRDTFIMLNDHDKPIPVGIRYKGLFASDNIFE